MNQKRQNDAPSTGMIEGAGFVSTNIAKWRLRNAQLNSPTP